MASTPPMSCPAAERMTSSEGHWRAMGSEVHAIVVAEPSLQSALIDSIWSLIDDLELAWSRFMPTSDVSRLNSAGGEPVRCERSTLRLVTEMVRGWWSTGGGFDPSILPSLVTAGYGQSRIDPATGSFISATSGLHDRTGVGSKANDTEMLCERVPLHADCLATGRVAEIGIDEVDALVQFPKGLSIDPGGIGKGLAADMAVEAALAGGADGALVSVGGDVAVAGVPVAGDAWVVEASPHPGASASLVRLRQGGIATSSVRKRWWSWDGADRHHVIDPHTGRPTQGGVVGATVVAGSAATAEVFTKCAFVDGPDGAIDRYERAGLAANLWLEAEGVRDAGRSRNAPAQRSSSAWVDFVASIDHTSPSERTMS